MAQITAIAKAILSFRDVEPKLIILMTLAYTSSIMSGQKIKNKGVFKYVDRVKEKPITQCRHSSFYIGIHGYDWV